MSTEKEYDEIIAPMLLAVAEKCKELGMTLVARCEWEPGESGITQIGDMTTSAAQMMTQTAAHSHGNVDKMLMHLIQTVDVSQSVFLHSHQKQPPRKGAQ
jgi:hypothetical protein